ncbi:hypothetical protein CCR90_17150 [Rhodovulum sulfidophilum]|uniref:hypothetical protein n=1 Tax=Rhodovulum sulfidophilum TaxID=35806 RepID=UPI001912F649|nr:hypothetical protein [Rhodovulum sulfidophilum]MBK5925462.1 hypothetical protein [Rhodovulum sulfidophilum]
MSRRPVVETDDIFPDRTVAELSGAEFLAHQSQDPADVAKAIRSADMAVVQFAPDDDAEVITGMAEGGALIRYGIGFGNIDVTAANDRGQPAMCLVAASTKWPGLRSRRCCASRLRSTPRCGTAVAMAWPIPR